MHRLLFALSVAVSSLCACVGPSTTDGGTSDGKEDSGNSLPVYNGGVDAGTFHPGDTDAGGVDAGENDAGRSDAGAVDSGTVDAGTVDAGGSDAGAVDSGLADSGLVDSGILDSGLEDTGPGDGGSIDAGASCLPLLGSGTSLAFDGVDDLGKYPAAQLVTPGAPNPSWALFGLAWDGDALYVAMASAGFEDPAEPLHVYLEAGDSLAAPTPSAGKEYGGLTPALPFTATHLVAARRQDDTGTGAYDGVYTPQAGFTYKTIDLVPGRDVFAASDQHTLAVRVPLEALGCPTRLRLAAHIVHDPMDVNHHWKDLVPITHTPWTTSGGGFYEIDLLGDPAVSSWAVRP